MISQDIEQCPHCGQSEYGYYYSLTTRCDQHHGFAVGHDMDSTSAHQTIKRCLPRCAVCKKVVGEHVDEPL
ncbi:hypothetical protein [Neptuniibacter sp. QD37_11]|uniref:hypothetical protein n=1 Tax=Neptuniibacter sp. QD37_11 TaxID=3398209 RepID=UPI0039F5D920